MCHAGTWILIRGESDCLDRLPGIVSPYCDGYRDSGKTGGERGECRDGPGLSENYGEISYGNIYSRSNNIL